MKHGAAERRMARRVLTGGLALAFAAMTAGAETPDHECHIFGLVRGDGAASNALFETLCRGLYDKTLPAPPGRETPTRDGWGFGYFFAPPDPAIAGPILVKGGPPPCGDTARWYGAIRQIEARALGGPGCVLAHVRKSSYGPDNAALPNPHPFADRLLGRWWLFQHNGHMRPDSLRAWIPDAFLRQHPLDYDEVFVDSELLFRYCQYEIERLGSVRAGLLFALHRVKIHNDFIFNLCLTDGDTLWTAHTLSYTPFYYGATADSAAWWASTVGFDPPHHAMATDRLYWFTAGAMGEASYE
jgi:predicted glutamine amidotransferase